jgi:hypothetical protein
MNLDEYRTQTILRCLFSTPLIVGHAIRSTPIPQMISSRIEK